VIKVPFDSQFEGKVSFDLHVDLDEFDDFFEAGDEFFGGEFVEAGAEEHFEGQLDDVLGAVRDDMKLLSVGLKPLVDL
jgi:hypothetical protein